MTISSSSLTNLGTALGLTVIAFLILPFFAMVPISLNGGEFFTLPRNGPSLKWYLFVFNDGGWRLAAFNSFITAISASGLALVLGGLAAIGLAYHRSRFLFLVQGFFLFPLVMPTVVAALAIFIYYNNAGLTQTRLGLIAAHTALGIPFVVTTALASLKKFDTRLFYAAISLGANPYQATRYVLLPSIAPGVLAGAVYAFQASFDESIISLFLTDAAQITLPKKIFAGMTDNINPSVAVVSVMTTLISIVLLLAFVLLERRRDARLAQSMERFNPHGDQYLR
ncbi:ABC transporter permease [Mesorhizobium wenxiniae]|nr:ABC transporter permease [Mesorhizobium wenxiniae]